MPTRIHRDGLTFPLDRDPQKDSFVFRMDWSGWLADTPAAKISEVNFDVQTGLVVITSQIGESGLYVDFSVKVDPANPPDLYAVLKLECSIICNDAQRKTKSVWFLIKDL